MKLNSLCICIGYFFYLSLSYIKLYRMKNIILLVLLMVGLSSCTKQSLAKNWGGKATIEIPKNNIVLSGSWKDKENLWIMTKDTITNEVVYREFSPLGLIEGSIGFKGKE